MLTRLLSRRDSAGLHESLAAMVVPALLMLALLGCGQQGPAKAEAAKTVVADTTAQAQPDLAGVSAEQPDSSAAAAAPAEPAGSEPTSPRATAKATGLGILEQAAAAGKHLLLFCYKEDDEATRAARRVFDAAARTSAKRAVSAIVKVTDAAQKDLVAKFQLDRAPMPLALVVAPGGAVTGGFPTQFTEEQLTDAFVSPGLASCLKALQDGKLVLACVQNSSTKSNDAAMRGVNAFVADSRFAKSTEIVSLDPADEAESKFLKLLQVDPKTAEAVTALIAPPGAVVAQYKGATDKEVMVAALAAKQAGGGGG